ncbi:TetR/AcrR family transcriptional regulator [Nocardia suismassiliense]|uniref:TetR/AcrR family transcriptional regulator n=1 Tax=Nocardia suismassiliense TaxID=2077092 RepID=UPI000D1EC0C3|nr:TetR family transcriptional regulator [Nocardia suismassiliense]
MAATDPPEPSQATAPRARKHRAAGAARRDALLRATVEVAAERGMAGVTHRTVTEHAGVPLATISYFFESIDALATEALRVFTAERVQALTSLNDALAAQQYEFEDMASLFADATATDRTQSMAIFEAFLHAGRNPAQRKAVGEALAALQRVAATALRAAGASDPEGAAESFVALVDGFAMHALAEETQQVDRVGLRRAARALFLGELVAAGRIEDAVRLSEGSSSTGSKSPGSQQESR